MQRVGFHGTVTSHPHQRPALIALMLKLRDLAARSPGCLLFLVEIAVDEPNIVWTTEVWRSQGEHDACADSAAAAKIADEIAPLLATPPEIWPLTPVGGYVMEPHPFPMRAAPLTRVGHQRLRSITVKRATRARESSTRNGGNIIGASQ
jgi:quinol monooxygenase YgiN